jgi:hypothetical protein
VKNRKISTFAFLGFVFCKKIGTNMIRLDKKFVTSGLELPISKLSNFSGEAKNNLQDKLHNLCNNWVLHYVTIDAWQTIK